MSLAIAGIGTANPPTLATQSEAFQVARSLCCPTNEQETWLPLLYSHTGINTRHLCLDRNVVDDLLQGTGFSQSFFLPTGEPDDAGPTTGQRMRHYAQHAASLAIGSSRQALQEAALEADSITHLVTVSCTGFGAPGVDIVLIKRLGLRSTVQRTHVGYMGCHGALNGLRVANAFVQADPGARVLLCATELCSVHYHYGWDPQKMVANAIFGDGSAALVGIHASAAPAQAWTVAASGSCLCPDSEDAMTWTMGDHGFEMTLAKNVPNLIATYLRPWLESWLAQHAITLQNVGSWAVHPGGPKIIDAVEEALDLDPADTAIAREVLARYGNMSSPTILFIIDRMRLRNLPRPCVALGFGPGLIVEAMLFR